MFPLSHLHCAVRYGIIGLRRQCAACPTLFSSGGNAKAYIVPLADLSAPQLSPYVGLTHAQLRSRRDPAQGTLIAESPNVISSALDAGCQPLSLLMEQRQLHTLPRPFWTALGTSPSTPLPGRFSPS